MLVFSLCLAWVLIYLVHLWGSVMVPLAAPQAVQSSLHTLCMTFVEACDVIAAPPTHLLVEIFVTFCSFLQFRTMLQWSMYDVM